MSTPRDRGKRRRELLDHDAIGCKRAAEELREVIVAALAWADGYDDDLDIHQAEALRDFVTEELQPRANRLGRESARNG